MTGRRGRVVKTDKQPQPHYEARESDSSSVDSLNIQEVREVKYKYFCEILQKAEEGSELFVTTTLPLEVVHN